MRLVSGLMNLKLVWQHLRKKIPGSEIQWMIVIMTTLIVSGCSRSHSSEEVIESGSQQKTTSISYRVQAGDTLSRIAAQHGVSWSQLARVNGLVEPFIIRPGDLLSINTTQNPKNKQPSVGNKVPLVGSGSLANQKNDVNNSSVKNKPPKNHENNKPMILKEKEESNQQPNAWRWPAQGAVITRFSPNGALSKGIDIGGQMGEPVIAALEGTVVYAGTGLKGYGELIIIKHSSTYVSAYGHNRKLLVREGQKVKSGQTISEMGSTGTDRVKLHFEIRRQGKPVDPLKYLPKP